MRNDLTQLGRWWTRYKRALMMGMTLAAVVGASVGVVTLSHVLQASARTPACSATLTASVVRLAQSGNDLALYPTTDVVPVDAQTAITSARQDIDSEVVAAASCMIALLMHTQVSFTLNQDVWFVAYHLAAGAHIPPGMSTIYGEDWWALVDAQTGGLISAAESLEQPGF